ncbi:ASCH domain-containing protein [Paenibacillus motobuensis]|uniref:ASCH domain-containing protein n=1 Tax=Paenibacillus motobuensis TaxID=295324 RepID=A0ABN0Y424_9BACL
MKAITIHQPWATLIALGEKRFETRSWPTKYRGLIAIHAGKKIDKEACMQPEISRALERQGYTANNLPTGAIVTVCNLEEVHQITVARDSFAGSVNQNGEIAMHVEGDEFAFGWYEEGRYAWELRTVRRITEPIPAKGQQGLWNWEGQ